MARQKGILKLEGSIGELSFYNSVFGPVVRSKGGASALQIKKGKNFVRVREQNTEFGNCSLAGKTFRAALGALLLKTKDHKVTWRVTQLMNRLKDLDTTSARGKRTVMKGLTNTEAGKLLKGFDLNSKAVLSQVLFKKIKTDTSTGTLSIGDLVPARDLKAPKGATHVSLKSAWLRTDFDKKKSDLQQSKETKLKLDKKAIDVVLKPTLPSAFNGRDLFLIQIVFWQEVNGKEYLFNNGEHTVLSVVEFE